MDPEAFRAESRDRWERSAAGWEATRERLQRDAAPGDRRGCSTQPAWSRG